MGWGAGQLAARLRAASRLAFLAVGPASRGRACSSPTAPVSWRPTCRSRPAGWGRSRAASPSPWPTSAACSTAGIDAVFVYRLISFWLVLLVGWVACGGLGLGCRRGRWPRHALAGSAWRCTRSRACRRRRRSGARRPAPRRWEPWRRWPSRARADAAPADRRSVPLAVLAAAGLALAGCTSVRNDLGTTRQWLLRGPADGVGGGGRPAATCTGSGCRRESLRSRASRLYQAADVRRRDRRCSTSAWWPSRATSTPTQVSEPIGRPRAAWPWWSSSTRTTGCWRPSWSPTTLCRSATPTSACSGQVVPTSSRCHGRCARHADAARRPPRRPTPRRPSIGPPGRLGTSSVRRLAAGGSTGTRPCRRSRRSTRSRWRSTSAQRSGSASSPGRGDVLGPGRRRRTRPSTGRRWSRTWPRSRRAAGRASGRERRGPGACRRRPGRAGGGRRSRRRRGSSARSTGRSGSRPARGPTGGAVPGSAAEHGQPQHEPGRQHGQSRPARARPRTRPGRRPRRW